MNDNDLDKMMSASLKAEYVPSEELNRSVMRMSIEREQEAETRARVRSFSWGKAIAISLSVLVVGSLGVYAATKMLKEVYVTPHAISVGNTDYVDDDAIASMDINETASPEYKTKYEYYDTYDEAVKKSGMGLKFSRDYKLSEKVSYSVTSSSDYTTRYLTAWFIYGDGNFCVVRNVASGNIVDNAAYSVRIGQASNQRSYESSTGVTYELVDGDSNGETATFVMISYDKEYGYIQFFNLSDTQIHEILDSIEL